MITQNTRLFNYKIVKEYSYQYALYPCWYSALVALHVLV